MIINEGLFKLDVTDHHAILGFSLAEDPKKVRTRYLKVARRLHPDSLSDASDEQKAIANEILSKLVNPSYKVLSQEKSIKEHNIALKMKQQQLVAQPSLLSVKSESAKKLLGTSNLEHDYKTALQTIVAVHFDDLTSVHSIIGEISELNAVYLMRQGNVGEKAIAPTASDAQKAEAEMKKETPRRPRHEAIIESYLSRAKEFEYKKDYSRAILELREAIATHPQSAPCHSYLALLYLKSGKETMAKIHAKQSLAFDPENAMAKEVQAKVGAAAAKSTATDNSSQGRKASSQTSQTTSGQKGTKQGGGLFSGLFGGKKG